MTRKSESPKQKEKLERKRRRSVDAYTRLQRAAALTSAAADAALAPFGLSASQLGVLETLQSRGPLHQQELARTLGRSKAQMTAIIDALEKRGAATRERHATDRRFTTVHLTEVGVALLAEAVPVRVDAVTAIMATLSGEQRTRLARLCRRLVKALAPEEDERESEEEHADVDAEGDDEADASGDDGEGEDEAPMSSPEDNADGTITR
ncbi:MAG: MarR family transcriptional regulator [bacterium]|nr:MarR family transcriptional regulator [bacterium]